VVIFHLYAVQKFEHMKRVIIIFLLLVSQVFPGNAQNVGIGTTTPLARLHVIDSAVLFSASSSTLASPYPDPPIQGSGIRMMWYPGKAAFRAGFTVNEWNKDNIGLYSTAFGNRSEASGIVSTSFGISTTASGSMSTSMGSETTASGTHSTSMGTLTIASGGSSTSMGNQTLASGSNSTSMGYLTYATGNNSTSMGLSTVASGNHSTSMGIYTFAKANGAISIGSYTDNTDNPDPNTTATTDRIFQLGNGVLGSRSNAVTVLRNGNTGIGVLNPGFILDVNGRILLRSSNNLSAGINLNNEGNTGIAAFVGMRSSFNEVGFYGQTGTNGWRFLVNTTTGNAWLQGALTQNSDMRLKTNIAPLSNTLNALQQIKGYTYNWKDASNNEEQIGLLAQELQKVYPQLVKENDRGDLSVNYSGLVPVLLEAIKELQERVAQLEEKLQ